MKGFTVLALVAAAVLALTAQASAINLDNMVMVKSIHRDNGVADGWEFTVQVHASVLSDAIFTNLGTSAFYGLTPKGGGNFQFTKSFASKAAMDAEFADGQGYNFYFNQHPGPTFDDVVFVGYVARIPQAFANITNPTDGQAGVLLNPIYAWDNAAAVANLDALGLYVDQGATTVFGVEPEYNKGRTTWQPGTLAQGATYEFDVALLGIQHNATGAPGPIGVTTNQGDAFLFYGVYSQSNSVDFTTQVPEPGTVALLGSGLLTLVGIGYRRRMK